MWLRVGWFVREKCSNLTHNQRSNEFFTIIFKLAVQTTRCDIAKPITMFFFRDVVVFNEQQYDESVCRLPHTFSPVCSMMNDAVCCAMNIHYGRAVALFVMVYYSSTRVIGQLTINFAFWTMQRP